MIDISTEGAGLVVYRPRWTRAPRRGDQFDLKLGTPGSETITCAAKVIWVDAVTGGRRMGVRFISPLLDEQLHLLAAEGARRRGGRARGRRGARCPLAAASICGGSRGACGAAGEAAAARRLGDAVHRLALRTALNPDSPVQLGTGHRKGCPARQRPGPATRARARRGPPTSRWPSSRRSLAPESPRSSSRR